MDESRTSNVRRFVGVERNLVAAANGGVNGFAKSNTEGEGDSSSDVVVDLGG